MIHELFQLISANPLGSFIIIMSLIWVAERFIIAFINRHKPNVDCARDCECDCDEEEVVAMGGQVDEND